MSTDETDEWEPHHTEVAEEIRAPWITADWQWRRALGITATDMPTIMGVNPWRTVTELVADKRTVRGDARPHPVEVNFYEVLDTAPNEAARWGILLEQAVARGWLYEHTRGQMLMGPSGLWANGQHPWMLCSPDRLLFGCGDPLGDGLLELSCLLEVKTRSCRAVDQWDDGPPADVLAQVQWQLAVTGLDHAHVACLFGGQELRDYRVDADPVLHETMIAAALVVQEAIDHDRDVDFDRLEQARTGVR